METRDCLILKIMKANGLLNTNYVMLQIQRRHLEHNNGLFFDKKECEKKIELREKIQDRLNNYILVKAILLIAKVGK